jgi:hypothetical protein
MQISNCDRCYRRKGKCDKLQPCGSCERAGVPCIYTDRTKERRYTADHVERLEKRIRQAEARNKSLADELSRVRASTESKEAPEQPSEQKLQGSLAATADAVTEVSFLSINAAGERQPYLGSSSGLLFADLIRSSVHVSPSRSSSTPVSASPALSEQNSVVSTVRTAAQPRRVEDLPSQQLAQRLVTAFLEHDNVAYPFLYPMFLLDTTEKFYSQDGYYASQASPFEVFVVNMVLAIASAHVAKFDWQGCVVPESHSRPQFY